MRSCPACGCNSGRKRGPKHNFEMMITCGECGTLYVSNSRRRGGDDYDSYLQSTNLSVSDFIHKRVEEIVAGFGG